MEQVTATSTTSGSIWKSIAIFIVFGGTAGLAALRFGGQLCELAWPTVHSFVAIFLSWPPIVLFIVVFLVFQYQQKIGDMIDRVREFSVIGTSAKLAENGQQAEVENPKPMNKLPDQLGQAGNAPEPAAEGVAAVAVAAEVPAAAAGQIGAPLAVNREIPLEVQQWFSPDVNLAEAVEWIHLNPGPTLATVADLQFKYSAERIFNIIFGTQVEYLAYLDGFAPLTQPLSEAAPFFKRHIEVAAGKSDRTLATFVGFLLSQGLARNDGTNLAPNLRITIGGQRFLRYIRENYSESWDKRPA